MRPRSTQGIVSAGRPGAAYTTVLRLSGENASAFPQRLAECGIGIRAPRGTSPDGAEFTLHTNETVLRRPLDDTISAFTSAI